MIVRCKALRPTPEEAAVLGIVVESPEPYMVTLGKSYVALGLMFPRNSTLLGNELAVAITDNESYVAHAPLVLFDVVDDRVSSMWILRRNQAGALCLWPPSFFADFYHDDLSSGVPSIVENFLQVYGALRSESGFSTS